MKKSIWLLFLCLSFIPSQVMGEAEIQKTALSENGIVNNDVANNKYVMSLNQEISSNPFGIYLNKNINGYIHPIPVFFTLILLITLIYTFLLKKMRDSYRTAAIYCSGYQPLADQKTMLSATEEENYFEIDKGSENLYFNFCDIPNLSDKILKEILIDTDNTIIMRALFGTDKKIVAAIVRNMSDLSRVAVKDELKRIGKKPSKEEIEEAKEVIASKISGETQKVDHLFSNQQSFFI